MLYKCSFGWLCCNLTHGIMLRGMYVAVKRVVWDPSGRNVGLQLIRRVFDTIPITRYTFTGHYIESLSTYNVTIVNCFGMMLSVWTGRVMFMVCLHVCCKFDFLQMRAKGICCCVSGKEDLCLTESNICNFIRQMMAVQ